MSIGQMASSGSEQPEQMQECGAGTVVRDPKDSPIAVGIVVFNPDPATFLRLLESVAADAAVVFLFLNSLKNDALRSKVEQIRSAVLIEPPHNVGIGAALNEIVGRAHQMGCRNVFLFDQDSSPGAHVLSALRNAFQQLSEASERTAVVGPLLISASATEHKQPRYFRRRHLGSRGSAVPVHYLPTSGTLISIDAFREVGPFRDDYFIDGIDLEWCFRAWSKGYSCWLATDVTMEHTVGEGSVGAFGFRTPHQKDFRLETYVRNTVYGFRLPHIPLSWKLRQAAYLVGQVALLSVANRFRPSLLKRLGRGFVNGLRGRLGPPEGVPFT